MNDILASEVNAVHELTKDNLRKKATQAPRLFCDAVYAKIAKLGTQELSLLLGSFGIRAKNFVDYFDIEHPHASSVLGLIDRKIILQMDDAIKALPYFVQHNLNALCSLVSNNFASNYSIQSVDAAIASCATLRLIKRREDREHSRTYGRINFNVNTGIYTHNQPVKSALFNVVGTALNTTIGMPSFKNNVRLIEIKDATIEKNKELSKRLGEMGMEVQSKAYSKRVNDAIAKQGSQYCGFNKVELDNCATILALNHGFKAKISTNKYVVDSASEIVKSLFDIMVPSSLLSTVIWHYHGHLGGQHDRSTVSETMLNAGGISVDGDKSSERIYEHISKTYQGVDLYSLQARLYGLNAFESILPKQTQDLLDSLEAFHDFDDKPLFDKFYVLVPGIFFESQFHANDGKFRFKVNDKKIELNNKEEALFLMDCHLIKQNKICPIILGKMNNDYYFLNYWERDMPV
jgi:hypothetical protein